MDELKHDEGKLRMDLIPPEAIKGLAKVLTFGTKKYHDRSWEKGICYSRIFAAVQRHLWSFWEGEDLDDESGLSHLDHAACGIAFLQTYRERGIRVDDRRVIPK